MGVSQDFEQVTYFLKLIPISKNFKEENPSRTSYSLTVIRSSVDVVLVSVSHFPVQRSDLDVLVFPLCFPLISYSGNSRLLLRVTLVVQQDLFLTNFLNFSGIVCVNRDSFFPIIVKLGLLLIFRGSNLVN